MKFVMVSISFGRAGAGERIKYCDSYMTVNATASRTPQGVHPHIRSRVEGGALASAMYFSLLIHVWTNCVNKASTFRRAARSLILHSHPGPAAHISAVRAMAHK